MTSDVLFYPPRSNNPLEIARRKFISALAALKAPCIGSFPTRDDFEAVKDHIAEVTRLADQWLAAIGTEVSSNSTTTTNMDYFASGFSEYGVNGCLFEIEKAAEACEEELV